MNLGQDIDNFIRERLKTLNERSEYMIGYPEYLGGYGGDFPEMFKHFIMNTGNPFTEPEHFSLHVKDFEREVIHYFMDLYGIDKSSSYGYITNGTTEGTMYSLYRARESFKNPILLFSSASHYSVEKVAKLLRIPYQIIPADKVGAIDLEKFEAAVSATDHDSIIFSFNLGTIVQGATDDIDQVYKILVDSKKAFHVHVDAALFGGYLPYIEKEYCRSLMQKAHSLAFSIYKFFGIPLSTGFVVVKDTLESSSGLENDIDYLNSKDSTISGTRNGVTAMMTYYLIKKKGDAVFTKEAQSMIENAKFLNEELSKRNKNPLLLPKSNTVYFNKPSREIINKWQLATHDTWAHVVVMPNVTKDKLKEFLKDLDKDSL